MNFNVIDLGKVEYLEAWERQKEVLAQRIEDKIPDTLIFCEHPAVVTLGRGSQRDGGMRRQYDPEWNVIGGGQVQPVEPSAHGPARHRRAPRPSRA